MICIPVTAMQSNWKGTFKHPLKHQLGFGKDHFKAAFRQHGSRRYTMVVEDIP